MWLDAEDVGGRGALSSWEDQDQPTPSRQVANVCGGLGRFPLRHWTGRPTAWTLLPSHRGSGVDGGNP